MRILLVPVLLLATACSPDGVPFHPDANPAEALAPTTALDEGWSRLTMANDYDADGQVDYATVRTWDDRGDEVMVEIDADGDGWFERITFKEHVRDADGRKVEIVSDEGADGSPDTLEIWERDANGRVVSKVRDEGMDGVPDRIETSDFTGGKHAGWSLDTDGDGVPEIEHHMERGPDGRLSNRRVERYRDGEHVSTIEHEMVYGEMGLELTLMDNALLENFYDDDGRLSASTRDADFDGIPDSQTVYTYDAGQLVSTATDRDMDGQMDSLHTRFREGTRPRCVCP